MSHAFTYINLRERYRDEERSSRERDEGFVEPIGEEREERRERRSR